MRHSTSGSPRWAGPPSGATRTAPSRSRRRPSKQNEVGLLHHRAAGRRAARQPGSATTTCATTTRSGTRRSSTSSARDAPPGRHARRGAPRWRRGSPRIARRRPGERPQEEGMLDHIGLDVGDYKRSKSFYERALAPLGLQPGRSRCRESAASATAGGRSSGSGQAGRSPAERRPRGLRGGGTRATVDAFQCGGARRGCCGQRRTRRARDHLTELLRGVRARPRREQRRGVQPLAGVNG